jgi:hypothetical protein
VGSVGASPTTVDDQLRRAQRASSILGAAIAAVAAGTLAFSQYLTPHDSLLALVALVLGLVWVVLRPSVGVYAVIGFALVGDISTTPWYPFGKNFSSAESILFISDGLILNPAEVFLLVTTASWLVRRIGDPSWIFHRGALLAPIAAFSTFVVLGLVYGLGRGGNVTIGLWEARPLLYLPILYVLVTNLLTSVDQYRRVMWVAMAAVTVHSLLALQWYLQLPGEVQAELQSLGEHAASVHANALLLFALAMLLLPGCSGLGRLALPLMALPVIWVYALAERRAAVVALAFGLVLVVAVLFRVRRRTFWWFAPTLLIVSVGYLGAFWNVETEIGFPAQSIKAVVAPSDVSATDQASADYRETEAINVWFTMRTDPIRGIGFGHAFYMQHPLPDISFFPFWQFLPHHSLLWIWLKTGFFGFVMLFFLMARAIQHAARSVVQLHGDLQALALACGLFIPMYLVFSYADIAWDLRSVVFLTFSMAVGADMVRALPADPAIDHTESPDPVLEGAQA